MQLGVREIARIAYEAQRVADKQAALNAPGSRWEELTPAQQQTQIDKVNATLYGNKRPVDPLNSNVGGTPAAKESAIFAHMVDVLRGGAA